MQLMFKAKCDTIYIINIWIYEGFNATTHLFLMMQMQMSFSISCVFLNICQFLTLSPVFLNVLHNWDCFANLQKQKLFLLWYLGDRVKWSYFRAKVSNWPLRHWDHNVGISRSDMFAIIRMPDISVVKYNYNTCTNTS